MTTALAAIVALLPSLIWLAFFLREDRHPEPRRVIIYVFLAGSAVTAVVVGFQLLWMTRIEYVSSPLISPNGWLHFFVLAGFEEVFKFLAAFLTVRKSRFFDEPIDAAVYLITAAMGFAAVENTVAILEAAKSLPAADFWSGVAEVASLRFVGATLLHALSSGLVGYFWAKGIIKKIVLPLIFLGLLSATAVHATFNYLVFAYNKEAFLIPVIFLIIVAFVALADFEKIKKYDRM